MCYLRCMVREDSSEGQHLSKDLHKVGECELRGLLRGECFRQCKDLEGVVCLRCLRNSKEAVSPE